MLYFKCPKRKELCIQRECPLNFLFPGNFSNVNNMPTYFDPSLVKLICGMNSQNETQRQWRMYYLFTCHTFSFSLWNFYSFFQDKMYQMNGSIELFVYCLFFALFPLFFSIQCFFILFFSSFPPKQDVMNGIWVKWVIRLFGAGQDHLPSGTLYKIHCTW